MTDMAAAFEGWTVVEVARGFGAATLAAKLLADLGCEVVKVEAPDGDPLRREPPRAGSTRPLYELVSATKRSVCIDTASDGAAEPLAALLGSADVLIVDADGDALLQRVLGADALDGAFPRLTLCRASAFGAAGPRARWQGGEDIVQAAAGTLSITGMPGQPTRIAAAIHTHAAALYAVTSILADRLRDRRADAPPRTRAHRLDTSLYDAALAFMTASLPSYFLSGRAPGPIGNRHSMAAPWNTFRCADGWIVVCAGNHSTWVRLCQAIALPGLLDDPRYATQENRVANVDALEAAIGAWTAARPMREVEALLDAADIPCGPILPLADVLASPQVRERALAVDVGGAVAAGGVFHWNGRALSLRPAEHALGAATRAVLRDPRRGGDARYRRWLADGTVREGRSDGVGLAA